MIPIYEVQKDDDIKQLMEKYDFSVISFYSPSSKESEQIDEYMDYVKIKFDQKMRDEEWSQRSLGWFRVDIESLPELSYDQEKNEPNQMVIQPKTGLSKLLNIRNRYDETEENVKAIAAEIRQLTGDWIKEIDCGSIFGWERLAHDQIVYYGPADDLKEGG